MWVLKVCWLFYHKEGNGWRVEGRSTCGLGCRGVETKGVISADAEEMIVLGETGARQFKHVFEAAQKELKQKFGMQMVELPVREKVTVTQRRGMPITLSSTITPLTISSRTTKRQTRHNIEVLGPNVNSPSHLPLQPPHPPPLKSTHLCHRINIHSSLHIPHIPNLPLRRHPSRSQA
jgi:MAGE family